MGDRAYCGIRASEGDRDNFDWEEWGSEESFEAGEIFFCDDQANYGGTEWKGYLVKAGIPFIGWNSAGCDYGAMIWAFDGVDETECLGEGYALVPVLPDGTIDPSALWEAMDYYRVLGNVEAYFETGELTQGPLIKGRERKGNRMPRLIQL
jgi:hypothetical protein